MSEPIGYYVNQIRPYGVEVLGIGSGVHFCVPARVWEQWSNEAWDEAYRRVFGGAEQEKP